MTFFIMMAVIVGMLWFMPGNKEFGRPLVLGMVWMVAFILLAGKFGFGTDNTSPVSYVFFLIGGVGFVYFFLIMIKRIAKKEEQLPTPVKNKSEFNIFDKIIIAVMALPLIGIVLKVLPLAIGIHIFSDERTARKYGAIYIIVIIIVVALLLN